MSTLPSRNSPITKKRPRISSSQGSLSREDKNRLLLDLVSSEPYAGRVGAFEGAAYRSIGLYRPELNCTMFSTHEEQSFCSVCREAIERVIDLHTGKGNR